MGAHHSGGHVSTLFDEVSDADILRELIQYPGTSEAAKIKLLDEFKEARARVLSAKHKYGYGVSVMVILMNTCGRHKLVLKRLGHHSGKDWHQQDTVLAPSAELQPCAGSAVFQAKRDGAAYGVCSGFECFVRDRDGNDVTTVQFGWWVPHGSGKYSGFFADFGEPHRSVHGTDLAGSLAKVFNGGGNGAGWVNPKLVKMIKVTKADDTTSSTAAVCFSVHTDAIAEIIDF